MRILVTGAESSGTSLVTSLLRVVGATVEHRSVPAGVEWLLPDGPWDGIIVCHRHGPLVARSQERFGHADSLVEAYAKQARGYALVYAYAQVAGCLVVQVSYEALVYEQQDAVRVIFGAFGLGGECGVVISNANAKWYGREPWFSDHTGP